MKKSASITGSTWLLFASVVALLAGAWAVRANVRREHAAAGPDLQALRAECASLAIPNAGEVALWRERQAALLAKRWTPAARAGLEERLGSRWRWVPGAANAVSRSFVLHVVAPETLPWSALVAVLAGLEAAPGATVEAITIATVGTRTVRTFARVEIHVQFQWAEAGTGHTVPPESVRRDRVLLGPEVPERGAEGRARFAALRRTSASAEPPAPARPPLRTRPDPPRRARSRFNLSHPKPT